MSRIKQYKGLDTDLGAVYKEIVRRLYNESEITVVAEITGEREGDTFFSVIATSCCIPVDIYGAFRELAFTIIGVPDNFIIEIHIGYWLREKQIGVVEQPGVLYELGDGDFIDALIASHTRASGEV